MTEFLAYSTLAHHRHPNVAQMLDYFVLGEPPARFLNLVFELCSSSLMHLFRTPECESGRLPLAVAKRHLHGAFSGVSHLHGLKMVHGDLTLANLLIASDGEIRVSDLGSCHSAHGYLVRLTRTTGYVRAPEAWLGNPKVYGYCEDPEIRDATSEMPARLWRDAPETRASWREAPSRGRLGCVSPETLGHLTVQVPDLGVQNMSVEKAESTPALDVWALGVAALCLLCGQHAAIGPYLRDLTHWAAGSKRFSPAAASIT